MFSPPIAAALEIPAIRQRSGNSALDDHGLRAAFLHSTEVLDLIAIVSAAASRVLHLEMFDEHLQAALGLTRGRIVEMQTFVGWPRPAARVYLTRVDVMYGELEDCVDTEIAARLEDARVSGAAPTERGATWTYLTTGRPFGNYTDRILKAMVSKFRK